MPIFRRRYVSAKQLRAWAVANPPYIYTIDNAVPADIADPVNVQWNHGNAMVAGDALYAFIQATIPLSSGDMTAAYVAMMGYPI